jgi:hypothetical protein
MSGDRTHLPWVGLDLMDVDRGYVTVHVAVGEDSVTLTNIVSSDVGKDPDLIVRILRDAADAMEQGDHLGPERLT